MYNLIQYDIVKYQAKTKEMVESYIQTQKDLFNQDLKHYDTTLKEIAYRSNSCYTASSSCYYYNSDLLMSMEEAYRTYFTDYEIKKATEIDINGEIIEIDLSPPFSTIEIITKTVIENTIIEKLKEGVIIKSMRINGIEINKEMLKNMNISEINYPLTYTEAYMAVYEPASKIALFIDSQMDVIKELLYISIDNILTNLIKDTVDKIIYWEESGQNKEYIKLIYELSDVLNIGEI